MLRALATFPAGLTKRQVGTLAKVKATGGAYQSYLGELRDYGLITVTGNALRITEAGMAAIGGVPLPSDPAELRAEWRSRLGTPASGAVRMFNVLVGCYPDLITRGDLAQRVNIATTGGAWSGYLGLLRNNGLIEESGDGAWLRAHPDLFLGDGGER